MLDLSPILKPILRSHSMISSMRDMESLCQDIANDKIHTHLIISGINFEHLGYNELGKWEQFCDALEKNTTITSIDFSNNIFKYSRCIMNFWIKFFICLARRNKKLISLNLSNNQINLLNDSEMRLFCDGLFLLNIQKLDLSNNGLNEHFYQFGFFKEKIPQDELYEECIKYNGSESLDYSYLQTMQRKRKEEVAKSRPSTQGFMEKLVSFKNALLGNDKPAPPVHRMGEILWTIANHPTLESVNLAHNDPANLMHFTELSKIKKLKASVCSEFLKDLTLSKTLLKINLEGNLSLPITPVSVAKACAQSRQYKHRAFLTAAKGLNALPEDVVKHILNFLEAPKKLQDQVVEEASRAQSKAALFTDNEFEFEIDIEDRKENTKKGSKKNG